MYHPPIGIRTSGLSCRDICTGRSTTPRTASVSWAHRQPACQLTHGGVPISHRHLRHRQRGLSIFTAMEPSRTNTSPLATRTLALTVSLSSFRGVRIPVERSFRLVALALAVR